MNKDIIKKASELYDLICDLQVEIYEDLLSDESNEFGEDDNPCEFSDDYADLQRLLNDLEDIEPILERWCE